MIEGIDVSHHQATTPSLAGLAFLAARATYGTFRDTMYATHVAAARRAGLVVIAYHFGRFGPVDEQVDAFLSAAAGADLFALDLEADDPNPAMRPSAAVTFIERVQSTGRPIGLYHSTSGYPADALGADWRWVADYRQIAHPPVAWDVWQYRGSPLDRDRFAGTVDELRHLGRKDLMGLHITLPGAPVVGELAIGVGVRALRVADGAAYRVPVQATRPAIACNLTAGLSGPGYLVDLGGDELHFIRASEPVAWTPPPPAVVDCTDVVNHELEAAAARAASAVRDR